MGSQETCGPAGVCTREVYEGWWARGKKYFDYLERVPERVPEELGMDGMHKSLLRRWKDEVVPPSAVGDTVDSKTYGTLLIWNRESETLIYYVTYENQGEATPGSTTPGPLTVVNDPKGSDPWPWIEGWEDPKKRALILNPKGNKKWTTKKILLVGGAAAGVFFVGKKMLADA